MYFKCNVKEDKICSVITQDELLLLNIFLFIAAMATTRSTNKGGITVTQFYAYCYQKKYFILNNMIIKLFPWSFEWLAD